MLAGGENAGPFLAFRRRGSLGRLLAQTLHPQGGVIQFVNGSLNERLRRRQDADQAGRSFPQVELGSQAFAAEGGGLGHPVAWLQSHKRRWRQGHCRSGGSQLALQFVVVQSQGSRHRPHTVAESYKSRRMSRRIRGRRRSAEVAGGRSFFQDSVAADVRRLKSLRKSERTHICRYGSGFDPEAGLDEVVVGG